VAGSHPDRSGNEYGLSSDLVDIENGGDGREEHGDTGQDGQACDRRRE
jgi:hypothetical protein